jgi:hypothetical protein
MIHSCSAVSATYNWRETEQHMCRNKASIVCQGKWWCTKHAPGPEERTDRQRATDYALHVVESHQDSNTRLMAEEFLKALAENYDSIR